MVAFIGDIIKSLLYLTVIYMPTLINHSITGCVHCTLLLLHRFRFARIRKRYVVT